MGAGDWWQVRREARRRRAEILGKGSDAGAEEAVSAGVRACGLRCRPRPPVDALLSGAHAVLDPEAGTVWLRADLAPGVRRLVLAHELAHFWLHQEADHEGEGCRCAEEDFEEDGAETLVGYGPRERQEAEANVFAREFLLPAPLLTRWFWEEGLCAAAIAARVGLPLQVVLSQLADVLAPEPPEAPPLSTAPPAPPLLDPSQQAAARTHGGPLLVGAGPGTGKTRTLTARVLYLTGEQGARPDTLLALTFSRRAAQEMRDRIGAEAPDVARRAFISTFHSYGLDLLRRYWEAAGLPPRPVLLDGVDAFALLERHVAALGLESLRYLHDPAFPLPDILALIGRAKEEMVVPQAFAERAAASGDERLLEVARVYAAYEELLRANGALDYADLVLRPVRLLEENPALADAERARWRHLLVDEYQDVNRAGARLVRLLAGDDGAGLWAVGDLRQAIYAFRGASPANVAAFETDYPLGRRTELGVNYRSRPALVALFGAACGEGTAAWRPARADSGSATLAVAEDDAAQADGMAARMRRFADEGHPFSDQVVLCRTRGQAAAMREALAARGIPVLPGGEENKLLSRPDVKDLLALLSRVAEPAGPGRHRVPDLPEGLPEAGDAWDFLTAALFGPSGRARRITDRSAVARLLLLARAFRDRRGVIVGKDEEPRRAFLRHIRRVARMGAASAGADETAEPADALRVLTVHAAKGLEFPVVFVPNLSRGKFPPQAPPSLLPPLPRDSGDEDDEEARLFFVALTRARDHLVVSRAKKYNGRSAQPSPLLTCLEQAAELRHEVWTNPPGAAAAAAAPANPENTTATGEGVQLEAWEAELYMRCPRRFYYERVLGLPHGEASPYTGFKRAVTDALRAAGDGTDPQTSLAACWSAVGPDPAHPHAPLYRTEAEKIVAQTKAAPRVSSGPEKAPEATLSVTLDNGAIFVRPDGAQGQTRLERHTFRKPPRDGKVESDQRLSLLREAAERYSAGGETVIHLRYVRTGEALPVPDKPRQRAKHVAAYDAALAGIRLGVFPATPDDERDCPTCPYFFICPI